MERITQRLFESALKLRRWISERAHHPAYLLLYFLFCAASSVVVTALLTITLAEVVVFTALAPGAALAAGLIGGVAGVAELHTSRKAEAAAIIAIHPAERRA